MGRRSKASSSPRESAAKPKRFVALGASRPVARHLFQRFPRDMNAAFVGESRSSLGAIPLTVCNNALTLYRAGILSMRGKIGRCALARAHFEVASGVCNDESAELVVVPRRCDVAAGECDESSSRPNAGRRSMR